MRISIRNVSGWFLLLLLFVISCASTDISSPDNGQKTEQELLPSVFQNGRIFVEVESKDGNTLRFFTDTAESTLIYESSAHRLGLVTSTIHIDGMMQNAAFLPPMKPSRSIPPPLVSDGLIPIRADHQKPPHHQDIIQHADGVLGMTWFASRSWTIDFKNELFYLNPSHSDVQIKIDASKEAPQDVFIPLHFRKEGNQRAQHYARLKTVIASDTLSLILKTGSSIVLSDDTDSVSESNARHIPAGLINESVYEKWRENHPDWVVHKSADRYYGSDIIVVPEVQIGTFIAADVSFSVRRDDAFSEWFSQFTDQPVSGALGPDAFKNTRITIDYPNAFLQIHDQ